MRAYGRRRGGEDDEGSEGEAAVEVGDLALASHQQLLRPPYATQVTTRQTRKRKTEGDGTRSHRRSQLFVGLRDHAGRAGLRVDEDGTSLWPTPKPENIPPGGTRQ